MAVFEDITERKREEEALQESEERFKRVSLVISDFAYSCRQPAHGSYQIDWMTGAVERITGYSVEEVVDRKCWSFLVLPEDLPLFERDVTGLVPGQSFRGELRIRHKSGEVRWLQTSTECLVDLQDPSCHRIFGGCVDITERKELEERIRQVRSDLLFAVSHDLKTPLQVLNQSQEMLNELTPGEGLARFQEYQQIWRRNLQRLERMINNLVDSQRGEEDRFPILLAPCRLEEIVQRVVEDLTGYALALQVQFNLQLEPVPESSCDEEAITRMVENLLTNAVKFSAKGGRVEIRLRMEDQTLRLEVEDHGLGIPANEQEQLFQPFQRGSAQRKGVPGTGLGLYICRRIMEAHGGSISLQSTEGVGTTVTVTLPLKK